MYGYLLTMVVSSIDQWIKVTPQCVSAIQPNVPFIIECMMKLFYT